MEKSNWNIKGYLEAFYDFNTSDYDNSEIKEFSQYEVLYNHEESGFECFMDAIKIKIRNHQIETINKKKNKQLQKNLKIYNQDRIENAELGYKPVA